MLLWSKRVRVLSTEIMLRDNRKFQFAVGVTAIVIVIRWLLTGDLLMAVEAARPPAEGETKSLTVLSVVDRCSSKLA